MPREIRIVLVETSHPGNIGAAARAMKTMCLERLVLVKPAAFPHPDATARASAATDVLDQAEVVPNLDTALAGCALVAGTSARRRGIGPVNMPPRAAVAELMAIAADQDVAVVFGRERTGLTNEELDRCNLHLGIPANPEYASLNLAAAVQIVAYEFMLACATPQAATPASVPLATADEMEGLYAYLESAALDSGFLDPANPRQLMRRLRHLFGRAQPDQNEINILRGLLKALQASSTGNT
ncbi:MAG: RNA methyltransferase [Gammaproteobacteria bacterium]